MSRRCLGPSWGPLRPSWGRLRGLLGRLGPSWGRLGPSDSSKTAQEASTRPPTRPNTCWLGGVWGVRPKRPPRGRLRGQIPAGWVGSGGSKPKPRGMATHQGARIQGARKLLPSCLSVSALACSTLYAISIGQIYTDARKVLVKSEHVCVHAYLHACIHTSYVLACRRTHFETWYYEHGWSTSDHGNCCADSKASMSCTPAIPMPYCCEPLALHLCNGREGTPGV